MVASVTVTSCSTGKGLDLECLDRVYLNAYVPNLQVGGQVVSFLTAHLGYPIPGCMGAAPWRAAPDRRRRWSRA
jgi:hypothetical protein